MCALLYLITVSYKWENVYCKMHCFLNCDMTMSNLFFELSRLPYKAYFGYSDIRDGQYMTRVDMITIQVEDRTWMCLCICTTICTLFSTAANQAQHVCLWRLSLDNSLCLSNAIYSAIRYVNDDIYTSMWRKNIAALLQSRFSNVLSEIEFVIIWFTFRWNLSSQVDHQKK